MLRSLALLALMAALVGTVACASPDSETARESDPAAARDTTASKEEAGGRQRALTETARAVSAVREAAVPDTLRKRRVDSTVAAGRALGESVAAIRARFGEPDTVVSVDTLDNPHTKGTMAVLEVRYPGLTFTLVRPSGQDRDLLESTRVTDTTRVQNLPFAIGAPIKAVGQRFGAPDRWAMPTDTTARLTYETMGIGATDRLDLHFEGNRLTAIEWDYYLE